MFWLGEMTFVQPPLSSHNSTISLIATEPSRWPVRYYDATQCWKILTDISLQSPRTRLSTTRARRLTVTGSLLLFRRSLILRTKYRPTPDSTTRAPGVNAILTLFLHCSIKKPKTYRYPSLKGTDPKFRRNHRHALHGTMKALVR